MTLQTRCWGKLELRSELRGDYNVANIALAVGALEGLISSGRLSLDKVPLRNLSRLSLHLLSPASVGAPYVLPGHRYI